MSGDEEIWYIYETKDSVVYRTDDTGIIWYKLCGDTWQLVDDPQEIKECQKAWCEYEGWDYIDT